MAKQPNESDRPNTARVAEQRAAEANAEGSAEARAEAGAEATTTAPKRERRKNIALRQLVDEMLASIRVAAQKDLWTPEERAQCESELAMIMARVRAETVATGDIDPA